MGRSTPNLIGKRFGRLLVVKDAGSDKGGARLWLCECDCGTQKVLRSYSLVSANTQSCGCLRIDKATLAMTTDERLQQRTIHGMHQSREYKAYLNARTRCENENHNSYRNYGGRGIRFCFTSFDQWLKELGPHPGKGYSVDRINNEGHYEPGNVQWSSKQEQESNKRAKRLKKP